MSIWFLGYTCHIQKRVFFLSFDHTHIYGLSHSCCWWDRHPVKSAIFVQWRVYSVIWSVGVTEMSEECWWPTVLLVGSMAEFHYFLTDAHCKITVLQGHSMHNYIFSQSENMSSLACLLFKYFCFMCDALWQTGSSDGWSQAVPLSWGLWSSFLNSYDDLQLKSECNTLLPLVTEGTGSSLAQGWKEVRRFYSGSSPCEH